ncbi:D-alanyl-D-alanine carboxypeptidase family protein [Calidifontibacillus oryziterrae]|uniref:D-alanyl-D-alanine carboxypeptidase family protein n=1 Tax=Calidifontibacillus oryziterrae TaxID=1191699 RepID=UPI0002E6346B|nr:serine hydrolase [Calidifontibacillus oryziterrae]
MIDRWTIFRIGLLFLLLFIITPSAKAEDQSGHAVFKDLVVESEEGDQTVAEPMIYFEGKSYLPLRVIANRLGKGIYLDHQTNNIVIESSDTSDTIENSPDLKTSPSSEFWPTITIKENISSAGAIIFEDSEQNIMFAKNAHSKFFPASTTKILTALVALEHGNLEDKVIVTEDVYKIPYDSSKAYINPGDELTLEQLLYGLLLNSGNDCGVAIAVHIAGSEEAFAELMNNKAQELGARNSNFVNSHGYDHPDHYTTPYDLALILKAASEYPQFLEVLETPTYKAVFKNKDGKKVTRNWRTTNHVFQNSAFNTDGIIGGKTGYTGLARHTLATVAEHNGHRYFVVTLKGNRDGRYIDTKKLLLRAYKARYDYDQKEVKKINVKFFKNSLIVDDKTYEPNDQLFIYKGRTYVAQSFLKTLFVNVKQQPQNDRLVKLDVHSLLTTDERIQPLAFAFEKSTAHSTDDNSLIAPVTSKLFDIEKVVNPFTLMLGMSIPTINQKQNSIKFY